jgi:hypothetical protein
MLTIRLSAQLYEEGVEPTPETSYIREKISVEAAVDLEERRKTAEFNSH